MGTSTKTMASAPVSSHLPSSEPRDDQLAIKGGHGRGRGRFEPYSWPHRFSGQQLISKKYENLPWLKAIFGSETLILEDPGEENGILHLLTEANCVVDQSHVAPLVAFLQGAKLSDLQQDHDNFATSKVAILIDGNFSAKGVCSRPCLGGLSAPRLLDELEKKRYSEDCFGKEDGVIDAERRLIYAVDLSRWGFLALVGSAPESLYRFLGDFLLNYIVSRPCIGIKFSVEGPETFAMEFSFPYSVWRTSRTSMRDQRTKGLDGEILRTTHDVTFMRALAGSNTVGEGIDAIHSSHISCIVTGYDQHRWTGILLCEAWYEDELPDSPTPDSIARYEDEQQDVEDSFGAVTLSDPLRRGKGDMFDSTAAMWRPRPYFLRVFGIRLGQIYKEFQVLITNMDKRTKDINEQHQHLLQRMLKSGCDSQSSTSRSDLLNKLDDFEESILLAKGIVKNLAQTVEELVSSGELFLTTDVDYFLHIGDQSSDGSDCYSYVTQIRRIVVDLRQLRQKLGFLQTEYEEMVKNGLTAKNMFWLRIKLNNIQTPVASAAKLSNPWLSVRARTSSWNWPTSIYQLRLNLPAVSRRDEGIRLGRTPRNCAMPLIGCLGIAVIIIILVRSTTGVWPCQTCFELTTMSRQQMLQVMSSRV